MNPFLVSIFMLLSAETSRVNGDTEFGAVTDTLQDDLVELYLQEWTGDPPSETELAITSTSARLDICRDITRNGVFTVYGRYPVKSPGAYSKLMLEPSTHDFSYYSDAYHLQQVQIFRSLPDQHSADPVLETKAEYTFACLLEEHSEEAEEEEDPHHIVAVHVSKVYDMEKGPHAHRFVFHEIDGSLDVMLAEGCGRVYKRPGFNVELHYIELRKRYRPALTCYLDPVCKLALNGPTGTGGNQVTRLCEIVLSSSYFGDRFKYPHRVHYSEWIRARISFRTARGRRAADGRQYFELMIRCFADTKAGGFHVIYISRAYNPYQVFVYARKKKRRTRTSKFYLKHLSVNVRIVHERYNLGEVEI